MATRIEELEIALTANTQGLDKATQGLNQVNQSFSKIVKDMDKAADKIAKSFDKINKSTRDLGKNQERAASAGDAAMARQIKTLGRLREKLKDVDNALRQQGAGSKAPQILGGLARSLNSVEKAGKGVVLSQKELAKIEDRVSSTIGNASRNWGNLTKAEQAEAKAATQAERATRKVATEIKKVSDASSKTEKHLRSMQDRMTDLAKSVQVALGPLSGVASRITAVTALANRNTIAMAGMIGGMIALGGVLYKSVRAGIDWEKQYKVLENRARTVGDTIGYTAAQMNDLAVELGEATLTTAGEAREAIIILSQVTDLAADNFRKALFAAQDLAASGLGSLRSEAVRLVRALEDPANAIEGLRRAGISFTEQEKRMIDAMVDAGKISEAQAAVLDKVNKKVGGNAVKAADSLAGAIDTLGERSRRFLEVLSTEGGALDSLRDSINRVNDQLNTWIDLTQHAQTAGTIFTKVLDFAGSVIGNLVENIDLLFGAITFLIGGKALLGLAKLLARATEGFLGLFRAIKTGRVAVLGLTRLFALLGPVVTVISLAVGAFIALASRVKDNERLQKLYNKTLERTQRIQNDLKDVTEGRVDALKAEQNQLLENFATEIAVQKAKLQALKDQQDLAQNLPIVGMVQKSEEKVGARDNEELKKQQALVRSLELQWQTLLLQVAGFRQELEKTNDEATDGAYYLAKAQEDAIVRIKETIDNLREMRRETEALIKGGEVHLRLVLDTEAARDQADKFLKAIADAVPPGTKDRLEIISKDQAASTSEVIAELEKLGITVDKTKSNVDQLTEGFTKLNQGLRLEKAIQNTEKFIDTLDEEINANQKLLMAENSTVEAVRAATLENELRRKVLDLNIEGEDKLIAKLRQRMLQERATAEAIENARTLRHMDQEIALQQLDIKLLDETTLRRKTLVALAENELSLIERQIPLNSKQAEQERDRIKRIIEMTDKFDKLKDRQKSLQDALVNMGSAFGSAIEDLLVNANNLHDVLQSLEKDILSILTRVLITEPIEKGIRSGVEGLFGPGGVLGQDMGLQGVIEDSIKGVRTLFGEKSPATAAASEGLDALAQAAKAAGVELPQLEVLGKAAGYAGDSLSGNLVNSTLQAAVSADVVATAEQSASTSLFNLTAAATAATGALNAMAAGSGVGATLNAVLSGVGNVGFGGAAGASGPGLGAALASNPVNLSGPIGFQHGGGFEVGGKGGTDSTTVAFKATPGEQVAIYTKQQQKKLQELIKKGGFGGIFAAALLLGGMAKGGSGANPFANFNQNFATPEGGIMAGDPMAAMLGQVFDGKNLFKNGGMPKMGGFGAILAGALMKSGGGKMPGFQHGGTFVVGGGGKTDPRVSGIINRVPSTGSGTIAVQEAPTVLRQVNNITLPAGNVTRETGNQIARQIANRTRRVLSKGMA